MKKTKRKFPLKLLRNQLILWFAAVIILLLGVIASFSMFTLKPYLYDTHVSHLKQNTSLLVLQLSSLREKLQSYSISILADNTVQAFLLGKLPDDPNISNTLRVLMMGYTEYDASIRALYLADTQGNIYGNNLTRSVSAYINRTLPDVRLSSGSAIWTTDFTADTVVMCRVIHDTTSNLTRQIGALYMMVDRNAFTSLQTLYLMDSQGWRLEGGALLLGDSLPVDKQKDDFISYDIAQDGWTLTTWIPKSVVYGPADGMLGLVYLGLTLMLAMGVLLIIFISGRLTKPLREIRHAMKRVGEGDLDTVVPVRRDDEIAQLAITFNRMIDDTKKSIRQNEGNQRRQRALELKTLQYQINPHFLYNTLDSIYMIARKSGNEDIASLVVNLSALFRLSLAHGQDFVTLEHEIKYVTSYLDIQHIRFPHRFRLNLDVAPELMPRRVLKFLLQPLVENSLSHGLCNDSDDGCISVSARREGDDLVVRVTDNGNGMTEEALEKLKAFIGRTDIEENTDPFAGGVGVRNVNQRMLLYYGRGIEIESQWEEGTLVTLRIPYDKTEQTDEVIV
ncbi:MAG: sensor histidine kinase [Eubacteriales bacterium]|nr:sensor histidine kinase [Eubacteriales bacterium]